MCGIIGYVGPQGTDVTSILLEGLRKLEYRGYDSAGIAVLTANGDLELRRRAGKIANLAAEVENDSRPATGSLGIGHTRWATHGRPNDTNAHPHPDCTGVLTVVHNGIIENYAELRQQLIDEGHTFRSETDTEVLSHLIEHAYFGQAQHDLEQAVRLALHHVVGAYAIVVASREQPDLIVGARRGGGPLIVGLGENEQFLASDIPAILKHTRRVLILDEGEMATLRPSGVSLFRLDGTPIQREPLTIEWNAEAAEKGGYPHFVLKEIFEQPDALRRALLGRIREGQLHLSELDYMKHAGLLDNIQRIIIVACGTSYHAPPSFATAIPSSAPKPSASPSPSPAKRQTPSWASGRRESMAHPSSLSLMSWPVPLPASPTPFSTCKPVPKSVSLPQKPSSPR